MAEFGESDFNTAKEHFEFLTTRNLPADFIKHNLEELSKIIGIDSVTAAIKTETLTLREVVGFYTLELLQFFRKIQNDETMAILLTTESLAIWGLELGRDGVVQMGTKILSLRLL